MAEGFSGKRIALTIMQFADADAAMRARQMFAHQIFVPIPAVGVLRQNNHHAFPRSARHGLEWWQPDFTYKVIVLLESCRVLWNVAVPPREKVLSLYQKTREMQG